MSTVILKWNPGFSSYTMYRFLEDLEKCALANSGDAGMNWSVWDADKIHKGDTCYLLKVGYGQTGIAARGTITSQPYTDEDWSWRDRPTKYCDFNFDFMVNPDAYPLLSSAELTKAIPDFDWNGGHSGLVLTDEQASMLERLWQEYMNRQAEYFDKASDANLFLLSEPLDTEGRPYSLQLSSDYDGYTILITTKEGNKTARIRIFNFQRILGKFGVRSWRALQKLLYHHFPTPSDLQNLCAALFRGQIQYSVDFFRPSEDDDEGNSEELED